MTVKEYSEKYKISKQAIYSKIQRGILKTEIKNNIKYIIVNIEQQVLNENNSINSKESSILSHSTVSTVEQQVLNEKIRGLEAQLQRAEADKEILNKRLEEANHIIAMGQQNINALSENIKALQYKNEATEENLKREKSKKWWQKIFSK